MGPQQVIEQVLGEQRFDAIIVSGDLTQESSTKEYADLLNFTRERLLPLLHKGKQEHSRVVFVPGNHDVNWGIAVGELVRERPWPLRNPERDALWKQYRWNPAASALRADFSTPGRVQLRKVDIDSAAYRKRFETCQTEFLNRFYTDRGHKVLVKPFNLLKKGDDWSAHQFVDEEVAIFGFNSCHGNDRYWTAAHIDHDSIANARTYWKQHCPGYQPVAVWHHGLTAEQGRPDFLTFDDLARLQEAGFRIGFHGHIHAANSWMLTQLRDDFVMIATGSLAAGKDDLQKGIGQQFSIVELHRSRVTVDVYERKGLGSQFEPNRSASKRFYLGSSVGKHAPTRSKQHMRTWSVDPNGILTALVDLTDLELDGSMVFAQLRPPFSNFEYKSAKADEQPLTVDLEPQQAGRLRFVSNAKGRYSKLTWSYSVSNAVALNRTELLKLREPVQRWYPNVQPGYDVRSHIVRHETDELVLRLEFEKVVREEGDPEQSQPAIDKVLPLVEEHIGDEEWKIAHEEQKRCKVHLSTELDGRRAELRVTAPVVGMRYGLQFRPKLEGTAYPFQARHLADNLLQQCRKQPRTSDIQQKLTDTIRINVANELLGQDEDADKLLLRLKSLLGESGAWIGFIWDEELRRLLATFGEFAPEGWGSRFAAGDGIAGHAFRQSGTAFWWKNMGPARLLYQNQVEPNQRPALMHSTDDPTKMQLRYAWIVSVPIYFSLRGRSLGVVSFAGKESSGRGPVAEILENLAYGFAHLTLKKKEEVAAEEWTAHVQEKERLFQLRAKLENAVNFGFWEVIQSASELAKEDRSVAKHFFSSVKRGPK